MAWNTTSTTAIMPAGVVNVTVTQLISTTVHLEETTATSESDVVVVSLEGVVSRELFLVFEQVLFVWGLLSISFIGIINNVLTITVFSKIGFKETVNISMTVIAFWDLVKCLCLGLNSFSIPLQRMNLEFGLRWFKILGVPLASLNNSVSYISGVLAAYVALERCLCVCLPFSVRFILTRKVVIATSVTLSGLVTLSYMVVYFLYETVEFTDVTTNMTIIIFQTTSVAQQFPGLFVYISIVGMIYPLAIVLIAAVCTLIIQYQLRKASKFRSESAAVDATASTSKASQLSTRDRQVIKMLIVIVLVNIVCFTPRIVAFLAIGIVPEFNAGRRYSNLFHVCMYFSTIFDLFNASINVFIFYSMSSQFKKAVKQLFRIQDEEKELSSTRTTD